MKISTLFIIDAVVFTEEQSAYFGALTAEWYVIVNNGTRQLVDALIEEDNYAAAQAALSDLHPNIIGKWDNAGNIIELTQDLSEYTALLAIPVAKDMHGWSGWDERAF